MSLSDAQVSVDHLAGTVVTHGDDALPKVDEKIGETLGLWGVHVCQKHPKTKPAAPKCLFFFSRDLKLYEIMLCKLVHCSPISAWEQDWSIQSTSGRVGLHFSKRWYIESVFRKKTTTPNPKINAAIETKVNHCHNQMTFNCSEPSL